jgi:hypothetical protein
VTATATPPAAPADEAPRRPSPWRWVVCAVVVLFAAFWIWALFFASKEAVNRIGDTAWAARAEEICTTARTERLQLVDLRKVDPNDRAMLAERGDLVDKATDIVERMLDDVVAVTPTDAKGQAIVPDWTADYRTYIEDRREFADDLRAGKNEAFSETAVDGIPISDKLSVFAGDNRMPTCSPPVDLAG